MIENPNVTVDTVATITSILVGFGANIFASGRWAGRIVADVEHLREEIRSFRARDFISRPEYEQRHKEILDQIALLARERRGIPR